MKSFGFEYSDLIEPLRNFRDGGPMNSWVVWFIKHGWVVEENYHFRKLTPLGRLAQRGIIPNAMVRVEKNNARYNEVGCVDRILSLSIDSNGYDEFGYQDRWARPLAVVIVRFPNISGEWCFYDLDDLTLAETE